MDNNEHPSGRISAGKKILAVAAVLMMVATVFVAVGGDDSRGNASTAVSKGETYNQCLTINDSGISPGLKGNDTYEHQADDCFLKLHGSTINTSNEGAINVTNRLFLHMTINGTVTININNFNVNKLCAIQSSYSTTQAITIQGSDPKTDVLNINITGQETYSGDTNVYGIFGRTVTIQNCTVNINNNCSLSNNTNENFYGIYGSYRINIGNCVMSISRPTPTNGTEYRLRGILADDEGGTNINDSDITVVLGDTNGHPKMNDVVAILYDDSTPFNFPNTKLNLSAGNRTDYPGHVFSRTVTVPISVFGTLQEGWSILGSMSPTGELSPIEDEVKVDCCKLKVGPPEVTDDGMNMAIYATVGLTVAMGFIAMLAVISRRDRDEE